MRRLITAAALSAGLLVSVATTGWAAEAEGCAGQATSYSQDGEVLDSASAPGEGGTQDDPMQVAWTGPIEWAGTTEDVLQDGTTTVAVTPADGGVVLGAAFEVASGRVFGGDFTNAEADTEREGTSTLADYSLGVLPATGTYQVDLTMTAAGGSCTGLAYLTIVDNPISSALWWVAAALILLGLLLLVFARPTARVARR
jgi:hypothetical protein